MKYLLVYFMGKTQLKKEKNLNKLCQYLHFNALFCTCFFKDQLANCDWNMDCGLDLFACLFLHGGNGNKKQCPPNYRSAGKKLFMDCFTNIPSLLTCTDTCTCHFYICMINLHASEYCTNAYFY